MLMLISSDGHRIVIEKIDEDEFLQDVSNGEYGDEINAVRELSSNTTVLDRTMYLIVRGQVVFPVPKTVVTELKMSDAE